MRTTLKIDEETYEKLRFIAYSTKRSLTQVVNETLKSGLGNSDVQSERTLGGYPGEVWISEDFNETPQEILDSMEQPI